VFRDGPLGTVLAEQAARAPLRCIRPFALASGEAVLQVLHVGPGVMAGDRLKLDVDVGAGARVVVVAQAATKLHAMEPPGAAEQRVRLRVAAGGRLEVHPGLTIPFAGSAFRQSVEVDLEEGATFGWFERWSAGRVARGERHAYRHASSRLRVRVGGVPVHADALELDPETAAGPGLFEGHAYVASGVFVGGGEPGLATFREGDGVTAAAYGLGPERWAARALADDGVALRATVHAWSTAWRAASGLPALDLDRYGS
jgi:urease accessory protein